MCTIDLQINFWSAKMTEVAFIKFKELHKQIWICLSVSVWLTNTWTCDPTSFETCFPML